MFELLFRCLISMGLAGSALFLLTLVLGPLWKKLGARLRRWALLAVSALFLLPLPLLFTPGGPLAATAASPGAVPEGTQPALVRTVPAAAPAYEAGKALSSALVGASVQTPTEENQQPAPGAQPTHSPAANIPLIAGCLYLSGTLLLLAVSGGRYVHFRRRLVKTSTPIQEEATQASYASLCKQLGLRTVPRLLQNADADTPFLVGTFRPVIVLPQQTMSPAQLAFALQHELTHYKNKDLPLKCFVLAVCVLHWANPFAWLLKKNWNDTCEQLCDEQVAERLDPTGRKAYVATLFHFACARVPFAAAGFASPAATLKKRLAGLLHPPRPSRALRAGAAVVLCISVLACLLAGCGFSAGAVAPDSEDSLSASGTSDTSLSSSETAPSVLSSGASTSTAPVTVVVPPASEDPISGTNTPTESSVYMWPVPGYDAVGRGLADGHRGLDILAAEGTPIFAAQAGEVTAAGWHYSYGYYVQIAHADGIGTLYAHCSELAVTVGQTVDQGEYIGAVGSTGNSTGTQCHFEMHDSDGTLLDPLDYVTAPP